MVVSGFAAAAECRLRRNPDRTRPISATKRQPMTTSKSTPFVHRRPPSCCASTLIAGRIRAMPNSIAISLSEVDFSVTSLTRRAKHLRAPFLRDFGFGKASRTLQNTQNSVRAKSNFASHLNARHSVQSLTRKNISLPFGLPAAHFYAVHSTKGRIAVVTDAELDAMATADITDEGCRRGRSSRVVLAPRCWSQVQCDFGLRPKRRICAAMVAKKPGTPGRARSSRKTIAQGMPDRFGVPVLACGHLFFCTQGSGCGQRPAFPAPSCFEGRV